MLKYPSISENEFWKIVDNGLISSRDYTVEKHLDKLETVLSKLSENELLSYELYRIEMEELSYVWKLYNAAYIIYDGCTDSIFTDFRNGLIVQGRTTFYNAINDPDSTLSGLSHVQKLEDAEGFAYLVEWRWCELKNIDFQEVDYTLPINDSKFYPISPEPKGISYGDDNITFAQFRVAMKEQYPKLFSKYAPSRLIEQL